MGHGALGAETQGDRSTAIGYNALKDQNVGDNNAYNTAVGYQAGLNVTTGTHNTLVGGLAGENLTTGIRNTFMGYLAGADTNIGQFNTAVGYDALRNNIDGDSNVAIGHKALEDYDGADGEGGNVAVGTSSGLNITTGQFNTTLGHQAGDALDAGNNNTIVGSNADPGGGGQSNSTVIGAGATGNGSNTVTLGDGSISGLHCQVSSISALSDKRDKTNIEDSQYGLNIIENLKPVTFEWNQRDGNRKGLKDVGFIAQDLQEVDDKYTRLVESSDPEKLQATYGRLIPILTKAIQELSAEVKELKKQING